MPEAGWYDDPQGGGGKRWWDGERWSEHTTPPAGSMPQTPAAPPAPPGAPAAGGWNQQASPAAGTWQPTAATPAAGAPKKGGAGKIVALVLVVLVVVVGIGVFLVVQLFSGSDALDVVARDIVQGEGETFQEEGEIAQVEGETVQIPSDGTWEMEVDLPDGLVVIDVRGLDDFDPVVELYDSSGTSVARNDDRSSGQQERYGGGFFDSLVEVEVPAGQYRVVVDGFAGEGGRATVSFPVTGG